MGELGLRIEGTSIEGTPAGAMMPLTRSFVPVSGSVGLVGAPFEGISVGLLGAISQRAPAGVELFARGPGPERDLLERDDVGRQLGGNR